MLLASLKRRWCVQRHKRKLEKAPPCLGVCGSLSTPEAPVVAENHTKNQLISDMNTFTSSQKHSSWFRRRRRRAGVSASQTVWDFLSRAQQLHPPGLHANEEHPKLPHAWRDTINNYQHGDACSACWWKPQQSCGFTFSCSCHDRHMYQPHTWLQLQGQRLAYVTGKESKKM